MVLDSDNNRSQPLTEQRSMSEARVIGNWDKAKDFGNYGQSNRNWGGMHINPSISEACHWLSSCSVCASAR